MAERTVEVRITGTAKQLEDALAKAGISAQVASDKITDAFGAKFRAKLDAAFKSLPDIQIDADSSKADAKLVAIKEEMDALRNKRIGVDLTDTEAMAKLDELTAKLDKLALKSPDVRVRVDAKTAAEHLRTFKDGIEKTGATARTFGRAISDLFHKTTSLGSALKNLGGVAQAAGSGGISAMKTGMTGLAAAAGPIRIAIIALMATALIPLAAVLTTVTLGLAGMAVAATAGVGAFALVAIPLYKQVSTALKTISTDQKAVNDATSAASKSTAIQKMQKDIAALNPTVAQLAGKILQVKNAFEGWSAQFKPDVFGVFNSAVSDLEPLMTSLTPLVHKGAAALTQFFTTLGQSIGGNGFKQFIRFLSANAVPAIDTLTHLIFGLGQGFANMLEGVGKAGGIKSVEDGINHLVDSFVKLSKSKGFQSFVAYAKKELPDVARLISGLAKTVVGLVTELVPVGTAILKGLSYAFQGIAWLTQNNERMIRAAISGIVAAFDWVKRAAVDVWHAIDSAWHSVESTTESVWNGIRLAVTIVWDAMKAIASTTVNTIKSVFSTGWATLKNITADGLSIVLRIIIDTFGMIVNGAAKAFGWIPVVGGQIKKSASDFNSWAATAQAAINSLHSPPPVTITVETIARQATALGVSTQAAMGAAAAYMAAPRAEGGPVLGNVPYLIGEVGPEIFIPNTAGIILPHDMIVPNLSAVGRPLAIPGATGAPGQQINVYAQTNASPLDIARETAWALKTAPRVA